MPKKDVFSLTICMRDEEEARISAEVVKASVPGIKVGAVRAPGRARECLASETSDFLLMDLETFVGASEGLGRAGPHVILACESGEQESARAQIARGAFDIFVRERGAGPEGGERLSSYFRVLLALRKRFRGAFSALERRYEDLVQALPDIIYELDTEGRFTFVNDAVRLLGYDPEELLGTHFSALLHDMDAQAVDRESVLDMYKGVSIRANLSPKLFNERRGLDRKTENLEVRIKRKPGSVLGMGDEVIASIISYGEVSAAGEYGLRQGQKEFMGSVGIIRDVTLRRKSEETLRKLYQAVDQLSVCVCVANRAFELDYINPVFSQTTQHPPVDVIGRDIFAFLRYTPERILEVRSLVLDGFDVRDEVKVAKSDGSSFWASVLLSPVRSPEGNITHAVAIIEDISARKTMEDLLRAAKEDAEAAARGKGEFLANLSLELKTPVSAILSAAQLIRMAPEDAVRNASQITKSARELLDMLTGILDLVRSESSSDEPSFKTFALGSFVRRICEPYREEATFRGLSFEILAEGEDVIESDPDLLGKILGILVDNAVKSTESGGVTVEYSLERKEGNVPHLALSIRDTGVGFTAGEQARIFQPFAQAGMDSARALHGVGLALARNLLRALGGEIRLESSPGRGSVFSILIPVGTPSVPRAEGTLPGLPRSFLVVDDNEVNLEYMRVLLEDAGHEVHAASGGMDALGILETRLVDLVFLDVQMPNMSGLELARRIRGSSGRRYPPGIPLIALTAFDPAELEDPETRFDGVFSKPADIQKLLAAAESAIGRMDAASPVLFSERLSGRKESRQDVLDKARAAGEGSIQAIAAALDIGRTGKPPAGADARDAVERLVKVFESLAAPGAALSVRQMEAFFSSEDASSLAVRLARLRRALETALARLGD